MHLLIRKFAEQVVDKCRTNRKSDKNKRTFKKQKEGKKSHDNWNITTLNLQGRNFCFFAAIC